MFLFLNLQILETLYPILKLLTRNLEKVYFMIRRILLSALLVILSFNLLAADYNIVDRFRLYEDRLKTTDMLRPYGHDFLLNINVAINPDVADIIDDAEQVSKTEGDKTVAATNFLNQHTNEEFVGRFDLHFGIPLPSFTVYGTKIVPDLRFGTNLGIQVATTPVPLTAANVADLLGPGVPQSVVDAVVARYDGVAAGNTLLTDADCTSMGVPLGTPCNDLKEQYKKPADTTIADLFAYAKVETRLGVLFKGHKGHFFGSFNPYLRHRSDVKRRYNVEFLAKQSELFDKDALNDFIDLVTDFSFGYRNKNWKIWTALEELKIANLKEKVVFDGIRGGETAYGDKVLLRLHSDYTFKFIGFKLLPFAGIHWRDGYDMVDGLYAGADFGWSFWKDRFGLLVKGMMDNEYFTVAPRITLWLMQLELMGKVAHKSEVDGLKIPNIYSFNFRLFF